MKIFSFIAFVIVVFVSNNSIAQSIAIVKTDFRSGNNDERLIEQVCYDSSILSPISNQMFLEGNPRYILVDLLNDGYITCDGTWYNIYVSPVGQATSGNINIPLEVRKAYGIKWDNFVNSIGEAHPKYGTIIRTHGEINYNNIIDPNSSFRNVNKEYLHELRLTTSGEIKLIEEILKDKLLSSDDDFSIRFSYKGYYVGGKELNAEMREKYMNLCMNEFGLNYYTDESSIAIGPVEGHTSGKRIEELKSRLTATQMHRVEYLGK